MKTIAEFIAEHGLTMESTPVPENPHILAGDSDWSDKAYHFHCEFAIAGRDPVRPLAAYFSAGCGIVEQWANKPIRLGPPGNPYTRGTVAYAEALEERGKRYRPDIESVLDCLASDAVSVWTESCFEDWAESLGYDTDSRSAERTYNTCREQALALKHFLAFAGFNACQNLLYETERL